MIRIKTPEDLHRAMGDLRAMTLMSQRSVASQLGVSASRVSDYERSRRMPGTRTVIKMLAILGWQIALVPIEDEEMVMPPVRPRAWRLKDYEHALRTMNGIRRNRDITHAQIAEALGASRQEVAKWLRGVRRASAHRMPQIAKALGYDLALVPREDA